MVTNRLRIWVSASPGPSNDGDRWPREENVKKIAIVIAALGIAAGLVAAGVSGTTSGDSVPSSAQGPSEEDFVPSEELPADSAIAFPVDI